MYKNVIAETFLDVDANSLCNSCSVFDTGELQISKCQVHFYIQSRKKFYKKVAM